jgi:Tol biopolymer transport system component
MVAFTESGEAVRTYGTYLRRSGSTYPIRLGDGGGAPSFSPDGKWVVTASQDAQYLTVLPTGPGEPRRLFSGNIERYMGRVDWFPDSRRVLFTAIEKGGKAARTFVQPVDGAPQPLMRAGAWLSPDGQRFLCREADQRGTCDLRTNGFEAIPNGNEFATVGGWSSDGRSVYASMTRGSSLDVYRVDVKTGARSVLKRIDVADPAGLIRIGGAVLTGDGQAYAYNLMRMLSQLFVVSGLN